MPDRDTILRRFTEWLDQALASEEPPAGVPDEILHGELDADGGADLYSMQAAITALTQEVKLQGRSFKQLAETLAPVLQSQAAEIRREAEESVWKEVLDALLDIRDRMVRGLQTARKAGAVLEQPRRWWLPGRRLRSARDTVAALLEGYRLTAERVDEVMARLGVREIDCLLQPFDPQSMRALDVEETARVPEATVVEVYRPGYEWNGRVYRPAEVKVTRLPDGGREEEQ